MKERGMFNELSEKADDEIIVKIAYTFYKDQKVEYIASLEENIRNSPDELKVKLKDFYKVAYLESSIETYLNKAQSFVEDFAKEIHEISIDNLNDFMSKQEKEFQEALNKKDDEYKSRIEGMEKAFSKDFESIIQKNPSSYLRGILQSLIASFIFLFITGSIIFITWLKDIPADKILSAFISGTKATEIHQESSENK